jgi:Virulence-associated protein E/Bifunctional DNA primase/polymerase, N-terminal
VTGFLTGAKIFPIRSDTKRPALIGWQAAATSDPAQHATWSVQFPGCAWAIACAESGLIGVEIDPKARRSVKDKNSEQAGLERAEQAWADLCKAWGFPQPLLPHVRSRSGGMHFYFRPAPGINVKSLKQRGLVKLPDWQQFVIETRVNGFLLIPPSEFEGHAYTRWPGGPDEPYEAPPQLVSALLGPPPVSGGIAPPPSTIQNGSFELKPLVKYIAKLSHLVGMPHDIWRAAIFGVVAQYGRSVAHEVFHHICDGSPETNYQIDDLVGRARETFQPGDATLASLFKYGHENGMSEIVPKTAAAMFGFPVPPLDIDAILAEIDVEALTYVASPPLAPTHGVPAIARGDKQAELWIPVLATVPHVERTALHPEMPDTGHPARAAINAAIPGIIATGNLQALAVIEATHPETAAKVGAITPMVKARAEALIQDAEQALAPNDYSRDTRSGRIESDNPDNLTFFLNSLGVEVRYNAWTEKVELQGWKWPTWTVLEDAPVARLGKRAGQTGTRYVPSKDFIWDMLLAIAHDRPVDPARDLLDQLEASWDGHSRLHSWLSHACGVPYDDYHQAVGATILLGLVARIRKPGVKFDLVPVFVSEGQGSSKSTLARLLAIDDEWFSENVKLGEVAKELVLLLGGKSVVEISEMRTRGEVDAVKAMISATHDEGRPAFGRLPVKRPRRNIFIGTTNRPEFLEDQSGGRRFLPIVVRGEIDLDFVRMYRAQLVGEAAALQSRGADINIPRKVWAIAAEHQLAATTQSSAEVLLSDWFGDIASCWISPANLVLLLRQALGRDVSRGVYADAMRKIGFVSKPCRVGANEEPVRVWVKGELAKKQQGYGPSLGSAGRPMLQSQFVTLAPSQIQTSVT